MLSVSRPACRPTATVGRKDRFASLTVVAGRALIELIESS